MLDSDIVWEPLLAIGIGEAQSFKDETFDRLIFLTR